MFQHSHLSKTATKMAFYVLATPGYDNSSENPFNGKPTRKDFQYLGYRVGGRTVGIC